MSHPNIPSEIRIESNVGKRFAAGFIDYLLIWAFFYVFLMLFGKPLPNGGFIVNGLSGYIPFLIWGFMTIGAEQFLGATIGNGLLGLKPVSIRNSNERTWSNYLGKPNFVQSLKRHLLDPIDMFFFGLVGVIIIKNTPLNQRVGDIWAKTIVIKFKEERS